MIALASTSIGLLLFGNGVALRLDSVEDVEVATAEELAHQLSSNIRARAGADVVIDDPLWKCEGADRCVEEIRTRTRMDDVVLIRVLGGPTRIQIDAERFSPGARTPRRSSMRIPRRRESGSNETQSLAEALFDPAPLVARPHPHDLAGAPEPGQGSTAALLSWALIGGGVAAGTIGAVLGARSAAASEEIRTRILSGDEKEMLAERQRDLGIAANLLFGAAVLALASGAVTWLAF